MVTDNLNPKWVKSFDVPYDFKKKQSYQIKIFSIDDPSNLDDENLHEFMGSYEFDLSEVVTSQVIEKPLENLELS